MAVNEKAPVKKPEEKKSSPSKTKKRDDGGKMLRIELVRSLIGHPRKQREVVKGLGLRKINSHVIRKDCPEIRGMINKIPHLLKVEAVEKK
jgi:large subunit ribosomal protein L30